MEDDLSDELQFHLQNEIEKNISAGMSPKDARNAALRSFGGVDQTKERCRDVRRVRVFDELWLDLRYGLRMLRKSPGFTAVAVVTLAIGIGSTTAVFGLVDCVLLKMLPVRNPEQLVLFANVGGLNTPFSYPHYRRLRDEGQLFEGVIAFAATDLDASVDGKAERLQGQYGLLSYSVAGRTHEIGIRMAVGAQSRDVLKLILGQGTLLTLLGISIGLVAAVGLSHFLSGLLYRVSAVDPLTYSVLSLAFILVASFACYIPARRATKVDPVVALRQE